MGIGPIGSFAEGLNQSIQQYLGVSINKMQQDAANQTQQANDKAKIDYQQNAELERQQKLEQFKGQMSGDLDPNTAENLVPGASKWVNSFKQQNGRLPTMEDSLKALQLMNSGAQKDIAFKEKQQQFDDREIGKFGTRLSSDREFTQLRTKRDNLENVGKLLEQVREQPSGPDQRQQFEIALAQVRTLMGSGTLSEKEIYQMIPNTYRGNISKFIEKISNKPEGMEAQAFMARALDFFEREYKLTDTQMARRVTQLGAPHKHVLDRNPDGAREIYSQYNVTHPKYNPKEETTSDDTNGWKIEKL